MLITSLSGRWLVQTDTSAYLLDLDAMTCVRYPGLGGSMYDNHPSVATSDLRRDREAIPLLGIEALEMGESMVLYLDLRRDGIVTERRTTAVRHCERIKGSR